ncbi:MAG: GMC family oxidoreductase [Candidatus Aminicenantes bacterium]|nr:GMC family oxidoreductase [Candidatus Aminicenantes bacterium]
MSDVTVVGSGASGVHFALSLLRKGYAVTMLDVGFAGPPAVNPDDTLNGLKENLADPVEYFLGRRFEALILPDAGKEYYGFPPSKNHVFRVPPPFTERSTGFEPLFSFARGGLAEAWTGGAYPFNDAELAAYPFGYEDLAPYYDLVAERIGILGADDDLARFYPRHRHLLPPLELDEHSTLLLANYHEKREHIQGALSCHVGRSRLAVLSRDLDRRRACDYSGRCLWGCPSGSLYTPSLTLEECLAFPGFTYVPNMLVTHFRYAAGRAIEAVCALDLERGTPCDFPVRRLVLAAGTLSTAKIFLQSIQQGSGRAPVLAGLMDNRQVLVPFITLALAGQPFDPETYQYHQLAMGIVGTDPREYVHGQITTLKTALMHPIIESMPLDLKTSLFLGRSLHAALGVANINFPDRRRPGNTVAIEPGADPAHACLRIRYAPPPGEGRILRALIRRVKRILWKLGAVVPPGMLHVRPMGASVHYAGTIPMARERAELGASEGCRSHDFPNLHFVDGTCFPFLPAKNLTLTLMANAARVADREF